MLFAIVEILTAYIYIVMALVAVGVIVIGVLVAKWIRRRRSGS